MITSVRLLDSSGSENEKSVEYELRYLVQTNDRADGPLTVRAAQPWRRGDVYAVGGEIDQRARVRNVTERQAASGDFNNWFVSVQFNSPEDGNQDNDPGNPLNDAIEAELTFEHNSKRTWIDGQGNVVCNTAGELYSAGLEIEDNLPVLSYSINQPFFSESLAMQVRNSVNATRWKIFAPHTVKLTTMRARVMFHSTIGRYFACQYGFAFAADAIQLKTISQGFNERTDSNGKVKLTRIKLGNTLITSPWPLDVDGKACERKERTNPNGDKEVYFDPVPHEQTFLKGVPVDFNLVFGFL